MSEIKMLENIELQTLYDRVQKDLDLELEHDHIMEASDSYFEVEAE